MDEFDVDNLAEWIRIIFQIIVVGFLIYCVLYALRGCVDNPEMLIPEIYQG